MMKLQISYKQARQLQRPLDSSNPPRFPPRPHVVWFSYFRDQRKTTRYHRRILQGSCREGDDDDGRRG